MDEMTHGVLTALMELNKRMEDLAEVNKYLLNELVQRGPDHSKQALKPLWDALGRVEAVMHELDELLTQEKRP